ncbi:unnamed protein product [Blepharisma stoltei]|uniref:Uncharacterized protein n=1 Tax=Blepharisma stoltei TaxID=1481888 RepID=A0AAU9JM09_9CILI|nr:unnamed protein product [Blepharisma stoltei]
MFRRNEHRLTTPPEQDHHLFDDGKDEMVSRIEFPLKQEIVVLHHKLEKLTHKYQEAEEDRKKYIDQMTLSADQLKGLNDENRALKEYISHLNDENIRLRQYISNVNTKNKKPKAFSNKLKSSLDGLKEEIIAFHDSFESQGKVVEKCLESLELNLDVGNKLRDLIEYYLDASKQTECQIKRLNANVNELCSDPCTFQGRIVMKKDLSVSYDSSSKNFPSLFDELNTANDKSVVHSNDNTIPEHIIEKLNHLETVLEEIKDTSEGLQSEKSSPIKERFLHQSHQKAPISRFHTKRNIKNMLLAHHITIFHV